MITTLGKPNRTTNLCKNRLAAFGAADTLAINFFGLRALSEALAPKLREGGSVVNVASIAGYGWRENGARAAAIARTTGFPDAAEIVAQHDIPNDAGYPVSKEILLVWSMLATHQEQFRRVNAVSPGPVETPILQQFRDVLGDARVNSDDIAPAVLFLCTDAARWTNGTNIATDGGLEAAVTVQAHFS